jgi:mono/diheme cytochrome c family protein
MKPTPGLQYLEGPRRIAPESSVPFQGPVLIAGEPATEPLQASEESLQRGEILFNVNCAICHGEAGAGGGPVAKYFPEAPPLNGERVQGLTDQRIFGVITNGYNRMPKLAENLTVGETWDVVNYVRSLSAE